MNRSSFTIMRECVSSKFSAFCHELFPIYEGAEEAR